MSFHIVHNDITRMETDAIVNAANSHLLQGGGVCGAIFAAAGARKLQEECNRKAPCPTGQAVLTGGYALKARYIIHAAGPIWRGGGQQEARLLADTYRNSLLLAKDSGCESISFPLISSGIYGYPREEALKVAVDTIREFLNGNDMEVYLVVFDRQAVALGEKLDTELRHYINTYFEENSRSQRFVQEIRERDIPLPTRAFSHPAPQASASTPGNLEDMLDNMGETFTEMLLRIIDEKGFTDVEVYKRANMDRKLFSKIRKQKNYHPGKQTVLALAVALRLSLPEASELLSQAGYAFSNSQKSDVIIRYFLEKGDYDIFTINEALFCYEQQLLGA